MKKEKQDFTHDDVDAIRYLTFFDGFMRALWWERLDPTHDSHRFARRLTQSWQRCFSSTARKLLGTTAPVGFDLHYGFPLVSAELWKPEWFDLVYSYVSFDSLLDDFHVGSDDPRYDLVEQGKKLCRLQVAMLSPTMIGFLRNISNEYMLWLRKHPEVIEKVSWEAFECIVAEVFTSKGFAVELTGRVRNDTCDVFAVRADEFGAETRYLIECKRYADCRRIGLSVVNQVIGAAKRKDVDHAFLVTTSGFTKDVLTKKAVFRDLRLHLRDGKELAAWIREYQPRRDTGLWLVENWEETI